MILLLLLRILLIIIAQKADNVLQKPMSKLIIQMKSVDYIKTYLN